jgi:hypothetical protein
MCLTEFSGYCAPGRAGLICQAPFRHTKLAIVRFQMWVKDGTLKSVLKTLAEDLRTRGELDLSECFIDGTFIAAKKGANKLERPSTAKAQKSWQWQTALVFLSPFTSRLLRGMKSNLSEKLSPKFLPANFPCG